MANESRKRLMRNRDYMVLLSGQTISSLGSAMSTFVFTLLAVAITGSPVQAGLVGAAHALGSTLASLPAGALVDRWNRKRILIACSATGAVMYSSVVVAIALDALTIWHLAFVGLTTGVSRAFFLPAQNAALRTIVQPDDMAAAMSANEGREHFAGLVGAPVGGVLYSIGRVIPVVFDALSYVVLTVAFAALKKPLPAPEHPSAKDPILRSIRTGIGWVMQQRAIRVIAMSATVLNFCAQAIILVLIVNLQQRGTASGVIGLLNTGLGIGGLLGAIAAATLLRRFTTGAIAVMAVWVILACFVATGFTTQPLVLVALLGGAIFFVPAFNAGLLSYQVIVTPDHMQGRAQSAIGFLATATSSLAPLAGGFLLEQFGARTGVLALSGLLLAAALVITLEPSIREIPLLSDLTGDEPDDGDATPAQPATEDAVPAQLAGEPETSPALATPLAADEPLGEPT